MNAVRSKLTLAQYEMIVSWPISVQAYADNIIQYGHQIGLHYDRGYDVEHDILQQASEVAIQREASWLEVL